MGTLRMTIPTQLVLRTMLDHADTETYGVAIGAAAGLASGTVHPILARLERLGWVSSQWEEVDPRAAGRPPRRYYQLTATGVEHARHELARVAPAERQRIAMRPAIESM